MLKESTQEPDFLCQEHQICLVMPWVSLGGALMHILPVMDSSTRR